MDIKLLVCDNIKIEEIQRHSNFMTLIKGQCQRSTLKFQDSCWSIAIVNPINIHFDVLDFKDRLAQVRTQGSQKFKLVDVTLTSLKVTILLF